MKSETPGLSRSLMAKWQEKRDAPNQQNRTSRRRTVSTKRSDWLLLYHVRPQRMGPRKCAGIREGARPTVVRFLKIRRSLVPWGFARGFALLPAPDDIVFRRQEFTRANRPGRAVQFRTSNFNCGHAPEDVLVARTVSI